MRRSVKDRLFAFGWAFTRNYEYRLDRLGFGCVIYRRRRPDGSWEEVK